MRENRSVMILAVVLLFMSTGTVMGVGGDFKTLDFVASAPQTYNHLTGGGAYNDRTVGDDKDIVESLEGGSLGCGDIVTYLVQIEMEDQVQDPVQGLRLKFSFDASTTGQPGVALAQVMGYSINYGSVENGDNGSPPNPGAGFYGLDSGIADDGGSTVSLVSTSLTGPLFQSGSELLLSVDIDDLEAQESVVLRIDVRVQCDPGSSPTGNLQARLLDATALPSQDSVSGGQQTISIKKVGKIAAPAIEVKKYVSVDNQVSYNDADSPPGPVTTIGNGLYFKLVVTNTGDVTLTNINLTDTDYSLSGCSIPSTLDPGSSFQCVIGPVTALAGQQINTATATGDYSGLTLSDSDPANYFGAPFSIAIEKSVSVDGGTIYHDADSPTGPTATVGDKVYFKFVVTNTSGVTLTDLTLVDTVFDLSGITPPIPSSLDPGTSYQRVIGPFSAKAGQHSNTATATGKYEGRTTSASDPAHYLGVSLAIDLEKYVSIDAKTTWDDADAPTGPMPLVDDDVYFKFVVTNKSNVTLTNITLTDPGYNLTGCTIPSSLAPGESFQCIIGSFPAAAGQQTNIATATGDYDGSTVSDKDPANYFGANPAIDIEKFVSVDGGSAYNDADSPPGPSATVGKGIYFKFVVTNTGNVPLEKITLTDPDYDLGGCPIPASLAPGASFECVIGPIKALAGQQTNRATARGDYGRKIYSDEDPANYFGAPLSIAIEKSVSVDGGTTYYDADSPTGPSAAVGSNVYFKIVVTNTNDVVLSNIKLTDSNYDLTGCTIPSSLDPGKSFTCIVGPFAAKAGQQTNTATVAAEHRGTKVKASDPANYIGSELSICLRKWIIVGCPYDDCGTCSCDPACDQACSGCDWLGCDDDDDDSGCGGCGCSHGKGFCREIVAGTDIHYGFLVHNTSNVTLTNIKLIDPGYDLMCKIPDSMPPNTVFECISKGYPARPGRHRNTARVVGRYRGQTVSDRDSAVYCGIEIYVDVEKYVSVDGGVTYHDADTAPIPSVTIGGDVYFKLVVTNPSKVTVENLTLVDLDYDLSGCTIPASLEPGGSFQCVIGPLAAVAGGQMNTAVATADYRGRTFEDSDSATYLGTDLSLELSKSVSVDGGSTYQEADTVPGPWVNAGGDVYFMFVVTNTSNHELTNIMLTDPDFDLSGCPKPTSLAPGTSFHCVIGPIAAYSGQYTNMATVTGEYAGETAVAFDSASYFGAILSVDVEKLVSVNGGSVYVDADMPSGPTAVVGKPVYFKFVATNNSNVAVTDISVTDSTYDLSGYIMPVSLAPGESFEFILGPVDAVKGQHTNTATLTVRYEGQQISDADSANYTGLKVWQDPCCGPRREPELQWYSLTESPDCDIWNSMNWLGSWWW